MASIDENLAFLQEAREAVEAAAKLQSETESHELNAKRLEKELAAEQKAVADSIEMTVKKRRSALEKEFNEQISDSASQLKAAQDKRAKARNEEVKARIASETAGTHDSTRQLKAQIKQLFKANGVPAYCNSTLFYALSSPKSLAEILLLILTFIICFAAVPIGLYMLFGQEKTLWLIIIYLADIIVFVALYFLLINRVKIKNNDALNYGHELRRQIKANSKQADAIARGIKKDKDETMYNLGEYDAEIERLSQEKTVIERQKKEALDEFENVGRHQIADEITQNHQERIDLLTAETKEISGRAAELRSSLKAQTLELTQKYEPLIGKDFMQADKLEALAEYFRSGQAVNITDAQELFRLGTPVEQVKPVDPELVLDDSRDAAPAPADNTEVQ